MLQTVDVGMGCLACYELSAGIDAIEQLRELASPLRGCRVLHVNATPYGGGVAEILRSEIPVLRDLGFDAEWKIIGGDQSFFSVTKAIHNGLQGARPMLSTEERTLYLEKVQQNAESLENNYDAIFIHDPQPLPLLQFRGKGNAKWIWRCHIDTSEPNPEMWSFVAPFLGGYDAYVFTLASFVPEGLKGRHVEIIPPAIDPQSPKNMKLDRAFAAGILRWLGMNVEYPFITQVSRFDPWKDPLGVIKAFQLIKKEMPELVLALVGSMALDDPEGWEIYRQVQDAAKNDGSIRIFTNLTGVGNIEVNAFQLLSRVVIQKSLREGFGLVVSEALWKGTPVVAGKAGGIPLQLQDDNGGYLVNSVEECAERTLSILLDPRHAEAMASRGRETVCKRFLLTRLIADELRLLGSLLGLSQRSMPVAQIALPGELRDPVCGMRVDPSTGISLEVRGQKYYFCAPSCREIFERAPGRFEQSS